MIFSHTLQTAEPGRIWQRWIDVDTWQVWDTEVKEASLEGDFELGAKGTLTPRAGPRSSFTITELAPGQSYTFTTDLPLCKLHVRRYLSEDKTAFTHEVSFAGVLAPFFGRLLGRRFQKVLPGVMANLRELAEAPQGAATS